MIDTSLLIALYIATLAVFCLATRRLPILTPEGQHRVSALDGLRGILATGVVVHHFAVTYYWHTTGLWQMTDSRLINNLGAVSVSLFFMITGYLFGGKIYQGEPLWGRLLASRVRRIFPMYLFSVVLIVAIAFYQSRLAIAPLAQTLNGIWHWVLFVGAPVNGFDDTGRINASVQWTLLYEAVFYLSLPVLCCLFHRRLPGLAVLVTLLVLVALWPLYGEHFNTRYIKLFVVGICVAVFEGRLKQRHINYSGAAGTAIAVAILLVCLNLHPYSTLQMLLLAVPFMLFVLGNSLQGLLHIRGLKILGEASFSIYVLHGIVLYMLFSVLPSHAFDSASFARYAEYLPVVLLTVAALSVVTYWVIERPCLRRRPPLAPATVS